ncbi:PEX21 (YGR239C) and PEX18 (YHR160C) [Zygosaccharomyces parabailii]|uniref:BN860_15544g1_1 n=1 Tax=Zygosaccharomyces bailii (strain CLIB 213 / ATCC 58445 / CBS 680 / BCRC 21525 / NBRC 1098 / NCYC 1416 / NRRL Y-2227) TaxID=1333698 RepID=A0A8J2T484_ZYGB2|nr:PEX21 (YGR239C) and PEX18 (YHR160C) [Zygosaccharomyces parabailii]CDF87835.1 BN860_15544g1_1 [Zygosaccharomyces bailii CLIB 213]
MSSCQVNPLSQFAAKGDQHPRFVHRLHQDGPAHEVQSAHAENVFLYGQDATVGNRFMNLQQSAHSTPLQHTVGSPFYQQQQPQPQQPQIAHHVPHYVQQPLSQSQNGSTSWLSQFHSMRIDDPLEVSSDYKKMYSAYERSNPMVRLPIAPNCRQNYNFIPRDTQDIFTPEFEALEKELEESEAAARPHLDQEQQEFQKIANEIVESCSSSPKLSSSKFMGLMKGIGEGSVTLNKQKSPLATELHSPLTGQRVGNEYFPVVDHTLHST